jgi:hypothetical protein
MGGLTACYRHRHHYRYTVPRMVAASWRYRLRLACRFPTGQPLVLTSSEPWVRASRHLWAAGRFRAGA